MPSEVSAFASDSEGPPAERAAMERALDLARRGWGRVAPNPLVGAVLLAGDRVVAEGYHAEYGGPHAEDVALGGERPPAPGPERDDLRVRSALLGVVTLGHHPVSREHHGAHQGIRSNAPPTSACEVEGAFHGRPLRGRSLRIRSECRYLRRHVPPWGRSPGTA